MVAEKLTDPVTDMLSPQIEGSVVQKITDELGKTQGTARNGSDSIAELLKKYGFSDDMIEMVNATLTDAVTGMMEITKDNEMLQSKLSVGIHAFVRRAVHMVLLIAGYLVLTVLLELLARVLDHVFDLPLLDMTNAVGGGMMGLLEAAALICVILFFAACFNITAITKYANEGHLMPLFMFRTPIGGLLPTK
jgi:hypothetical protein